MRTRVTGEARERLRQLLMLRGRTLGLLPPAVELLVGSAVLERWPAGEEIVTAEMLGSERVAFVVCGAAKVVCETPRGKRIGVAFVPPGRFVGTGWASEDHLRDDFRIIAHDPLGTIVALWTPRAIVDVLATSSPQHALQFVAASWRVAADVLRQKCHLLGSCLRDRVLAVLTTLAHDFGRPHPDGLRIELRVTHNDLAAAAVGSRANVTRALEDLRTDGLVLVDDHRLVVTHRGLAGMPTDPPRGWPDRIALGAH
jgi:CRP-like cAMP-binding protein